MESLKYTHIQAVLAKVARDLQIKELSKDTATEDSVIEWVCEAYMQMGFPQFFWHKELLWEKGTHKYRSPLPCGLVYINMIHWNNVPLLPATQLDRNKWQYPDKIVNDVLPSNYFPTVLINGAPLDGSGNITPRSVVNMNMRYFIDNQGMFCTLFDGLDGEFYFSYEEIPTDENGYPMILDNALVMEALKNYVSSKIKYPAYIDGKISPAVYKDIERSFYVKMLEARGQLNMPTVDERQSYSINWMRMIPNSSGFYSPNGMGNVNSPINRFF
jgi:hypothetical protein